MSQEHLEGKTLEFPQALDKVPESYWSAVIQNKSILEEVDLLFSLQLSKGIINSPDISGMVASPYQMAQLRRSFIPFLSKTELKMINYRDDSDFRRPMDRIYDKMDAYIEMGYRDNWPEHRLIEAILRPQMRAYKTGEFERARFDHLNIRRLPRLELVTGVFDRYLGPQFTFQGWSFWRNDGLTGSYDDLLKQMLKGSGEQEKHRVLAGDVLHFAGLARKKKWNGNTLPSEDNLRKQMGSIGYIFDNVLSEKYEQGIRAALLNYAPDVRDLIYAGSDIKEAGKQRLANKGKRAIAIAITGHEGYGHSQVPFDETSGPLLGVHYTQIKETLCDLLYQERILQLPKSVLSDELKKLTLATSLTWSKKDIDDYHNSEDLDPDQRKVLLVYAQVGAMVHNIYLESGCIKLNEENGTFSFVDINNIIPAAKKAIVELNNYVRRTEIIDDKLLQQQIDEESRRKIQKFIAHYINSPRHYFEEPDSTVYRLAS